MTNTGAGAALLAGERAPLAEVAHLAEVWDRAHQEKYETYGACVYDPSCVASGHHANPFRVAIARRTSPDQA